MSFDLIACIEMLDCIIEEYQETNLIKRKDPKTFDLIIKSYNMLYRDFFDTIEFQEWFNSKLERLKDYGYKPEIWQGHKKTFLLLTFLYGPI